MISAILSFLRDLPHPWGSITAAAIGLCIGVPMLIYLYRSESKRMEERWATQKRNEKYVRDLEAKVQSLQLELDLERAKNSSLREVLNKGQG